MKSIFIFLTCFLSLSFFYSCGDTEDADVLKPIAETEAYIPDNSPETWIVLSDEYVAELMKLEMPLDFEEIEDPKLRQKYHHVLLLELYADIPQVRTIIEYEFNLSNWGSVFTFANSDEHIPFLTKKIAYLEALLFLSPDEEGTQKALERTKRTKLHLTSNMDQLRKEDPELYVELQRDRLIEVFGDIPEVHIYTKILLKILLQEPLTDAERRAYLEAVNHLWPDRKQ